MTTPIFLIIRTWLQVNFEYKHPHHIFFDFCPAIYIERKKEKEKREAHREREEKESDPTRPATVIRSDLPFRATVSVELGTDQKPLSRWSSPCRLCRRKVSRKPPIEAAETPPRLATDCACRESSISIFSAHEERGKTQPRLVLEPWKAAKTRSSAVFY